MGQIFAYSLTSSILLAAMYLVYKWILSSENYHRINRAVLLLIYVVAICIPVVMPAVSDSVNTQLVRGAVEIGPLAAIDSGQQPAGEVPAHAWLRWVVWLYLAGIGVVLLLTAINLKTLLGIIVNGDKVVISGRKVVVTDSVRYAPFSFGSAIVMSRQDYANGAEMILRHESGHVELHHWADLLAAQLVCAFQWYNPAAWLMREELKAVHEYQADEHVIAADVDIREYQMLLIRKAVGARFQSLANSLNHSKLKKRITMMFNQKKSRLRAIRPLALVPALGIAVCVSQIPAVASAINAVAATSVVSGSDSAAGKISNKKVDVQVDAANAIESDGMQQSIQTVSDGNTVAAQERTHAVKETTPEAAPADNATEAVSMAQEMPQFPGGESAMIQYLIENIKTPAGAENMSGRVVVRFVVGTDGAVRDVSILKSVNPLLDAEAVRVVKTMPAFTPGKTDGQPVAVHYVLPIQFKAVGKDEPSKNTAQSIMQVTMTDNGKDVQPVIYINGVRQDDGQTSLMSIDNADIESMSIDKSGDRPAVYVTVKKK